MTCPKECSNEQRNLKEDIQELKDATFLETGVVKITAKESSDNKACLQKKMSRKEAIGYGLSVFAVLVTAIITITISGLSATATEKEKRAGNSTKIEVLETKLNHISEKQDVNTGKLSNIEYTQQEVLRTLIKVNDNLENLDEKIKSHTNKD